jgi:hypothetical protein
LVVFSLIFDLFTDYRKKAVFEPFCEDVTKLAKVTYCVTYLNKLFCRSLVMWV